MSTLVAKSTPCPVDGCKGRVARGRLLCYPCWQKVPTGLQREVWATWTAWKQDFTNRELKADWRAAADTAIEAVS